MAKHPVNTLADVTNLDPHVWAAESYKITQEFVYLGIQEGVALPSDYVAKGVVYAEKQIVTAGYRLANLLKTLQFKSNDLFL